MLRRNPRPYRLTWTIVAFALLDVVGMVGFAVGLAWLVKGQALLFRHFPDSQGEALVALVGGLALMVFAASRMLRDILNQARPD